MTRPKTVFRLDRETGLPSLSYSMDSWGARSHHVMGHDRFFLRTSCALTGDIEFSRHASLDSRPPIDPRYVQAFVERANMAAECWTIVDQSCFARMFGLSESWFREVFRIKGFRDGHHNFLDLRLAPAILLLRLQQKYLRKMLRDISNLKKAKPLVVDSVRARIDRISGELQVLEIRIRELEDSLQVQMPRLKQNYCSQFTRYASKRVPLKIGVSRKLEQQVPARAYQDCRIRYGGITVVPWDAYEDGPWGGSALWAKAMRFRVRDTRLVSVKSRGDLRADPEIWCLGLADACRKLTRQSRSRYEFIHDKTMPQTPMLPAALFEHIGNPCMDTSSVWDYSEDLHPGLAGVESARG